jgi:hypothetical protein
MNNGLDNLLRRIHVNPFARFADLSDRQKQLLNTISQMIANNEYICEENIKKRIPKDIDIKCCFWSLWHKRILIT